MKYNSLTNVQINLINSRCFLWLIIIEEQNIKTVTTHTVNWPALNVLTKIVCIRYFSRYSVIYRLILWITLFRKTNCKLYYMFIAYSKFTQLLSRGILGIIGWKAHSHIYYSIQFYFWRCIVSLLWIYYVTPEGWLMERNIISRV